MKDFITYVQEFRTELDNIFKYWSSEAIDPETNQFYGSISWDGIKDAKANKGIIMYSRQLWSFSLAAKFYSSEEYAAIADNTYKFFTSFFEDKKHGGYFWETDFEGNLLDDKKQTYAQAFSLYALTEYYKLTKKEEVAEKAHKQFNLIIEKCFDPEFGGYMEGFTREWEFDKDNRLSEKDAFAEKSMNTNLHVLEAFMSYCETFKTEESHSALKRIILDFNQFIVDADSHLVLFMDKSWKSESHIHSYGHDIEAAWMLWEGAEILGDKEILGHTKVIVQKMVNTFIAEGFDKDGAVYFEKHTNTGQIETDRHWWPQCEAMEGLACAYGITGNEEYLKYITKVWEFIKQNVIDYKNGEWHTVVDKTGKPYPTEDKGGMWKTPYHNGRALFKLVKRFES